MSALAAAAAAVEDLCSVHETLYTQDAEGKTARLSALRDAVFALLDAVPPAAVATAAAKAQAALLRGRALDACSEYSPAAEAQLSRAVKLDPQNAAAWAALGNCVWKKLDVRTAAECYTTSHKRVPSTLALRALSQLARAVGNAGTTLTEHAAAYRDSVEKAKAAVALGVHEPANWAMLGVAYLLLALNASSDIADLESAKRAFSKAASLEDVVVAAGGAGAVAAGAGTAVDASGAGGGSGSGSGSTTAAFQRCVRDPDLHFNRAQVLALLDDFDGAAASYEVAGKIDPTMPWAERVEIIRSHAKGIAALVSTKGGIAEARLQELTALASAPLTATESAAVGARAHCATAGSLVVGANPGAYVCLVILGSVTTGRMKSETSPPGRLVVLDAAGAVFALSVHFSDDVTIASLGELNKPVARGGTKGGVAGGGVRKMMARVIVLDPSHREARGIPTLTALSPAHLLVNGNPLPLNNRAVASTSFKV